MKKFELRLIKYKLVRNQHTEEKVVQIIGRYIDRTLAGIAKTATDATWYRLYDELDDILSDKGMKFSARCDITDEFRFKSVIVEIDTTEEDRVARERMNAMWEEVEDYELGCVLD